MLRLIFEDLAVPELHVYHLNLMLDANLLAGLFK